MFDKKGFTFHVSTAPTGAQSAQPEAGQRGIPESKAHGGGRAALRAAPRLGNGWPRRAGAICGAQSAATPTLASFNSPALASSCRRGAAASAYGIHEKSVVAASETFGARRPPSPTAATTREPRSGSRSQGVKSNVRTLTPELREVLDQPGEGELEQSNTWLRRC